MTSLPVRTTDQRIASYRRYILDVVITALQSVFNSGYDRDRQLQNFKILPQYPREKQFYPCIVVSYQGQLVRNSGVGHEEWFDDVTDKIQKWNHRFFEGEVNFDIYAQSTIDRDIALDGLVEVLAFGRLDQALLPFFTTIYGDPNDTEVELIFNQLVLNVDELTEHPNSVTTPPWNPEDALLYTTGLTVSCIGGFYNIVPDVTWERVERVTAVAYPQFEQTVEFPIELPNDVFGAQEPTPLANTTGQITNPRQFFDEDEVEAVVTISADES